jgi:protein TonB
MPRDLFGDVTRPSISIGNRKWYTVPVSLLSHSAVVLALVAIPILAPALLPRIDANADLVLPITPIIPPTPPLPAKPVPEPPIQNMDAAPTVAPEGIAPEKETPVPIDPGFENRGTVVGSVLDGRFDSTVGGGPPPLPAPPAPVRVGGVIRRPQIVRQVNPVYPPVAQAARVQGIVIIEATIAADGSIMDTRLLRSEPLLDQAALDAVRQWRYTPTLLNGVAVPVIMTVTVSFTLSK